jgi:multiple sugar transport system substrate-binding protein
MRILTSGRGRACALAVAAVLVAVTSCSGGGSGTTSNEIIVLSGRDDSSGGQRDALVRAWNRDPNHEIKARIVELTGSADQQHNEMLKEAQAPDSHVDVFNLDVTWTAEFADAGYVTELDVPPDVDDFLPGPLQTARYRGSLYALPFNTDAGLLFYNRDLVTCPADWNAIQDDVESVLGRPEPRPAAVWAGQLKEYDGLVVNVLETLHALIPDQRDLFETGLPALQEAVDTLSPTRNPGRVLRDALNFDEGASVQALREGEVAMLRAWPVARGTLTAPSAENPTTGTNIDVCQLPGHGAVLGGQNLAVSGRSAHATEAEELVRYLTSCEAERTLFDEGGLAPTRACAFTMSRRPADDFTKATEEAVKVATPRPQGPCYGRFSGMFSKVVHRSMLTDEPLPPGFLDDLNRALNCKPPRQ